MLITHSRPAPPSALVPATIVAAPPLCLVAAVAIAAWGSAALVLVGALVPATVAAAVDLRAGRLPDRLVVAAGVPSALVLTGEAMQGRPVGALAAIAVGAALFAGPLLAIHLAAPAAMGFGDVKLAGALGGALAMIEPRASLVALCVASATTLVAAVVLRRGSLPFGPGIVIGSGAAIVVAALAGEGLWPWR